MGVQPGQDGSDVGLLQHVSLVGVTQVFGQLFAGEVQLHVFLEALGSQCATHGDYLRPLQLRQYRRELVQEREGALAIGDLAGRVEEIYGHIIWGRHALAEFALKVYSAEDILEV